MARIIIDVKELTSELVSTPNHIVTGDGIFDKLMTSVNTQIDSQYKLTRIKGAEYASVYLGAMQTCISEAVKFLLAKDAAEWDMALKEAQLAIYQQELSLKLAMQPHEIEKILAEISKLSADTQLSGAQKAEVLAGTIREDLESIVDKDLKTAQKVEVLASTVRNDLESTSDIALKTAQKAEVLAGTIRDDLESTSDIALKTAQKSEVLAGTIRSNNESTADIALKGAQTTLVGKQGISEDKKALLIVRQTAGFDDDAKQKLLKQALDSWAVAYSVAKDANSIPDSIKVNPIDSIMKSAMTSLSVAVTSDPLGQP